MSLPEHALPPAFQHRSACSLQCLITLLCLCYHPEFSTHWENYSAHVLIQLEISFVSASSGNRESFLVEEDSVENKLRLWSSDLNQNGSGMTHMFATVLLSPPACNNPSFVAPERPCHWPASKTLFKCCFTNSRRAHILVNIKGMESVC